MEHNQHQASSDFLGCSPAVQTYQQRRGSKISNPVISAMLSHNVMRDCTQVTDMFNQCKLNNEDPSIICETAKKYYETCTRKV
mmetsp:Transcript_26902/g.41191  ORF Transcript_26902/g.41191 Transcript_26902/m.41191 type:complete len:83 (-) Transcript_26902:252-500(-)